MVYPSVEAAKSLKEEGISATVINCRTVNPLDKSIVKHAELTGNVLIVEENIRYGGLGGAILEFLADSGLHSVKTGRLGLPDKFVEHGPLTLLKEKYRLDKTGIIEEAKTLLGK
jgi:1-deoxy-D-xylulose-5-phosphate synthase